MKKLSKFLSSLALTAFATSLPLVAAAQNCVPVPGGIPCPNQTVFANGVGGIRDFIGVIANWLFVILLIVAVLYIILAAYKYLFSGGNDEAVAAAHKMLLYAVVAIAVAFLAKGIVFVVQQLVTGSSAATSYDPNGGYNGGNGNNNGGVNGNLCVNGNLNSFGVCVHF